MKDDLLTDICAAFEYDQHQEEIFPSPLFYDFHAALRFELGGDYKLKNARLPRFMQAFGRATRVAETIFGERPITCLVRTWDRLANEDVVTSRIRACLQRLDICAPVRGPAFLAMRDARASEAEYGEFWFRLDDRPLQPDGFALIWSTIAFHTGLEPSADPETVFYLADLERGIVLYVYECAGMDLVAMDVDTLRPIYHRFKDWLWLMEDGRARMQATFE